MITYDAAITDAVLMIIIIIGIVLLALALGAAFEWLHNRRR